jgi:hypothetical protein
MQVFRGAPTIHNDRAMPLHSIAGPRSAGTYVAEPIIAPSSSVVASPVQGGMGIGGMAHSGFGRTGSGHR